MLRTATLTLLTAAATALAQPAITIDVQNPVLRPGESTMVTMRGGYARPDYAVAGIDTDLVTSVGSTGWSDAAIVPPMNGPATTAGSPSATGYDGIIAGQLNFIGAAIYADPSNPIAFWQATYTAPMDAAAPFDIDLSTMTSRYDVYVSRESSRSVSRLADLVEGSGTIRVIPAAPTASALLLGGLLATRRRR